MDEEITFIMLAPQLMPESTDPAGSERKSCLIVVYRISAPFDDVQFIDKIDDEGLFIVIDFDRAATHWSQQSGDGVVLCEADGGYSWWFNDITK